MKGDQMGAPVADPSSSQTTDLKLDAVYVSMSLCRTYLVTHRQHSRSTKNARTECGTLKRPHVVSGAAQFRNPVWHSAPPPPRAHPLARSRWADVGRVLDP